VDQITRQEIARITEGLSIHGALQACPACAGAQLQVLPFIVGLGLEDLGRTPSGPRTKERESRCAVIGCELCGYLRLHRVAVLGIE
jgi:hypothetical protein